MSVSKRWGAKLVLPRNLFTEREIRPLADRVQGELDTSDDSCLYVTIISSRSEEAAERRVGEFCKGAYRLHKAKAAAYAG